MSGMITVEDYNNVVYNYKDSFIYKLPTDSIQNGGRFDNKFSTNKVQVSGGRWKYTFKFKTHIWNGMYYVLNEDDEIVITATVNYTYYNGEHILEVIVPDSSNYFIGLYMSPLIEENGSVTLSEIYYNPILENNVFLNLVNEKYIFTVTRFGNVSDEWNFSLKIKKLDGTSQILTTYTLTEIDEQTVRVEFLRLAYDIQNVIELDVGTNSTNRFIFYRKKFKNKNIVVMADNPILNPGKVNELDFLVTYSSIENYPITCILKYNGIEDSFDLDIDEYQVRREIDLKDKLDLEPVNITIELTEGFNTYKQSYDFIIPCEYKKISSFADLNSELSGTNNCRIIEIEDNITLTEPITINHDTIIKGGNHTLNLNEYGFTLNTGCNIQISNLNFINGDCTFLQENNSRLELTNCNFTDCKASEYNGLGSVVHCNIDIENLNKDDDFFTIIKDTNFTNCSGAIYHSGELLFEDNSFLLNSYENINVNSPAFLYQVDGACTIRRNTFDIDLDTDYYCSNEINLKLGQCLFVCGENATVNHSNSKELQANDNSSLFDTYNNIVHTFAKYYYPSVNACVYTSPIRNKENKSVCYAVSGVDWIFKENIQITRATWQTENRINNIEW